MKKGEKILDEFVCLKRLLSWGARLEKLATIKSHLANQAKLSDPTGIRTPVFAVRGRYPEPLDDGASEK